MKIELSKEEIGVLIKCIDTAIMFYITHKWKLYSKKGKLEGDSLNKLKEKFCIEIMKGEKMMIELGDKVKDTITDFEGTAISKIIHLNGCIRYEVKPQELKDGKTIESEWIDETQLFIRSKARPVKTDTVKDDKDETPGGPGSVPSELSHP